MSDTRDFPLGAVISVVDGRLVAPIGDVHELLDWMAGEPLLTHQLPRVSREARPVLIAQIPGIADAVVPNGISSWEEAEAFLAPHIARWGGRVPVHPISDGDHTEIDPISELRMMRPDLPIVVVAPQGNDR